MKNYKSLRPIIEQENNKDLELQLSQNKTVAKFISRNTRKNSSGDDLIKKLLCSCKVELTTTGELFSKESRTVISVQDFIKLILGGIKEFNLINLFKINFGCLISGYGEKSGNKNGNFPKEHST